MIAEFMRILDFNPFNLTRSVSIMLKPILYITAFVLLSGMQLTGCSNGTDVSNRAKQPIKVAAPSSQKPSATRASTPSARAGIVKSASVAGAYTYIETDINGQLFWIATTAKQVSPGEKIAWNDHATMRNFTSKALNRTFDQILFVDRLVSPTQTVAQTHNGKVVEVLTSAGYSYIHVEENGKKLWLAAPQMILNTGQTIRWSGGSIMRDFSSRSLNRTFNEIHFVSSVQVTSG